MRTLLITLLLLNSLVGQANPVTIFTAKSVITMEPAQSRASAVAVADGTIVGVGTEESLQVWIDARGGQVDRRFQDKIIMPGFIDPHVHPGLPAILTQLAFLAPDDWSLPTGEFPGAKNPADYQTQLQNLAAQHTANTPFGAWGYHELWHGKVRRQNLDTWFPDRAVFIWQRSFHEVIFNTKALEAFGITQADVEQAHGEADWESGHFWENGLFAIIPKLGHLFEPQNYLRGTANFLEMVHRGGVTTAVDMGLGISGDPNTELAMLNQVVTSSGSPMRLVLTPVVSKFIQMGLSPEEAVAQTATWRKQYAGQVSVRDHFKLMVDGAIFSALAQFGAPGYLDGHEGVWLVPEEPLYQYARAFWKAGYQLHAHSNGDAATQRTLDLLERLLEEHPRWDHRFALEHFAYNRETQSRRIKELGAIVSANPYYHYILSDIYSTEQIGPTRAEQMVRLGSLERLGVPFTFHSDSPMAPLEPLTLAWTATNRETINGNRTGQDERVSLDAALRAITIDAAWAVGMEHEIGSITAGKKADFVVLEEDPYEVGAAGLRGISIWGTVFEGRPAPIQP